MAQHFTARMAQAPTNQIWSLVKQNGYQLVTHSGADQLNRSVVGSSYHSGWFTIYYSAKALFKLYYLIKKILQYRWSPETTTWAEIIAKGIRFYFQVVTSSAAVAGKNRKNSKSKTSLTLYVTQPPWFIFCEFVILNFFLHQEQKKKRKKETEKISGFHRGREEARKDHLRKTNWSPPAS